MSRQALVFFLLLAWAMSTISPTTTNPTTTGPTFVKVISPGPTVDSTPTTAPATTAKPTPAPTAPTSPVMPSPGPTSKAPTRNPTTRFPTLNPTPPTTRQPTLQSVSQILSFSGSQTDRNGEGFLDVEAVVEKGATQGRVNVLAYFRIRFFCAPSLLSNCSSPTITADVDGVLQDVSGNLLDKLNLTDGVPSEVLRLANFSSGALRFFTKARQLFYHLDLVQNTKCPDGLWACHQQGVYCCLCPLGASCVRGQPPVAREGWISVNGTFLQCTPDSACSNDTCVTPPYENREGACNVCVEGYYRKDQKCAECPATAKLVLAVGVLFFVVALLVILKFSKTSEVSSFAFQISLGFIQLISIYATLPLSWPAATVAMFDVLSFTNFNVDLFSPECAISSTYWSKWVLKMMFPVIAACMFALLFLLVRQFGPLRKLYIRWLLFSPLDSLMQRQRTSSLSPTRASVQLGMRNGGDDRTEISAGEKSFQWEETHLSWRFFSAMTMCGTLLYTFLAKTTTDPLNCVTQTDGSLFVKADPSVLCYDSTWNGYMVLVALGVLLYIVGIPVCFFFVLFRAFRSHSFDDAAFYHRFGTLLLPYRNQFWYWELVQTTRKLVTVLLVNFGAGRELTSSTQINGLVLALLLFLAAQEFVKPYQLAWCNRVAFAWTVTSILVLVSALLFQKQVLTPGQENGYAAGLIVACIVAAIVSIICFIKEKQHARHLRNELQGMHRLDKEKAERKVLIAAFGPEVGPAMFRRARSLSARQRSTFIGQVARISPQDDPVPCSPELQQRLEVKFGPRAGRILASSLNGRTLEELLTLEELPQSPKEEEGDAKEQ